MGTGTNGVHGASDQTRGLSIDGMAGLLHMGYDHGVTFGTAPTSTAAIHTCAGRSRAACRGTR